MRKLNRKKIAAPVILTDKKGGGMIEKSDAIKAAKKYFGLKRKPSTFGFKYKIYRSPEVKASVCQISAYKCAYCEVNVRAGFDGDIEHFRPKGAVLTKTGKLKSPAYYWLATDWNNLFLSCDHCNKGRKRKKPDGTSVTSGKMNQFPLTDERKRVDRDTKKISREKPYQLLIDPCEWDPGKYLLFKEDGTISAISGKSIWAKRAQATIDVFALYREDLVSMRDNHAKIIRNAIESYMDLRKHYDDLIKNKSSKADIASAKTLLKKQIDRFELYIDERQLFSTLAYQMLKKEIKEFPY